MIVSGITNKIYDNLNGKLFQLANNNPKDAEKVEFSNYSYWKSTFKIFISKKATILILAILVTIIIFSIIQPYFPGQKDPLLININPESGRQDLNHPPCKEYLIGTNSIGQDIWARMWSGTRTSLFIGVIVSAIQAALGILVGVIWGYVKKLQNFITGIYNVLDNIPTTIIMVLVSYILKPSMGTLILVMCLTGWLGMARFVRNQVIIIRDREYNLASRCLGTPTRRILIKNLLPFLISVIMLTVALSVPSAIGYEVFLTFIGLGLPVNIPSLGNLINEGRGIITNPALRYQLIYPAIMISIITISFYILGNNFADAADPKNHV